MKNLLIGLLALGSISAFAGSTPYEKASKISEMKLGCQLQREALESELSNGSDIDLEAVAILRDVYDACFDGLEARITKGGTSDSIVTSLKQQRLVCEKELRTLENLLSESPEDLDLAKIEQAKKKLNECSNKVKAILVK